MTVVGSWQPILTLYLVVYLSVYSLPFCRALRCFSPLTRPIFFQFSFPSMNCSLPVLVLLLTPRFKKAQCQGLLVVMAVVVVVGMWNLFKLKPIFKPKSLHKLHKIQIDPAACRLLSLSWRFVRQDSVRILTRLTWRTTNKQCSVVFDNTEKRWIVPI